MYGLKSALFTAAVVVCLGGAVAQAQTYIVPSGYGSFPMVGGTVYTPVPVGTIYTPAYRYVTPASYVYGVPGAPVIQPVAAEVTPTPAGTVTTQTTTVAPTPAPAPVAVPTTTTTTYFTPAYPVTTYVAPVIPARVKFYPRRGLVRVRY
jgi:hypothetical protein